ACQWCLRRRRRCALRLGAAELWTCQLNLSPLRAASGENEREGRQDHQDHQSRQSLHGGGPLERLERGYMPPDIGHTWLEGHGRWNCSPSLEQAAGQALNLASRGRAPQRPNKIASAFPWDRSSSRWSGRRDARPSLWAKRSNASIACSGTGRQPASRSWCWRSSSAPRCWWRTDGADRAQETESA